MRVKKFIASSMPEAMQQIRKELGADAVILSSKEVRKRRAFGLFSKKQLEVVAALDPQPAVPKKLEKNTGREPLPVQPFSEQQAGNAEIVKEIKQLKKVIEQQALQQEAPFSGYFLTAYEYLISQDVEKDLAKGIVTEAQDELRDHSDDLLFEQVRQTVESVIEHKLADCPFNGISYDRKIVHFAGPTGVGKTTTLAKIAARGMLQDGKKVAFITADTFRIAAIDQLKTYAKILDVPVKVAYSREDYISALEDFRDYDLILVDTAGRNFKEERYVRELNKNLAAAGDSDVYLVLSLTAKQTDLDEVYKQFSPIGISGFIFTKLDETSTYGSMLNMALNHKVGIPYIANGQEVPDDILVPDAGWIASMLTGGMHDA